LDRKGDIGSLGNREYRQIEGTQEERSNRVHKQDRVKMMWRRVQRKSLYLRGKAQEISGHE